MPIFGSQDHKRTARQVQQDPTITKDHVVVEDKQVSEYAQRGYTLVEDLEGPMSLMKQSKGGNQS